MQYSRVFPSVATSAEAGMPAEEAPEAGGEAKADTVLARKFKKLTFLMATTIWTKGQGCANPGKRRTDESEQILR